MQPSEPRGATRSLERPPGLVAGGALALVALVLTGVSLGEFLSARGRRAGRERLARATAGAAG